MVLWLVTKRNYILYKWCMYYPISPDLKFIRWLFSSDSLMRDCFVRKQILQLNEEEQYFRQ